MKTEAEDEPPKWKGELAHLEAERAAFEAGFWYGNRGSMGYVVPGLNRAWRDYMESKAGSATKQHGDFYREPR